MYQLDLTKNGILFWRMILFLTFLRPKFVLQFTIKQRVYSGGTNGSEVVSYVILNGGHTWPKGYQYLSELIIGKTSQDMNACEVIWTFFKRFKRQ